MFFICIKYTTAWTFWLTQYVMNAFYSMAMLLSVYACLIHNQLLELILAVWSSFICSLNALLGLRLLFYSISQSFSSATYNHSLLNIDLLVRTPLISILQPFAFKFYQTFCLSFTRLFSGVGRFWYRFDMTLLLHRPSVLQLIWPTLRNFLHAIISVTAPTPDFRIFNSVTHSGTQYI